MVSWRNGSITLRFRFHFAKIVFTTALPPYDPSSFFHFSFSIFHIPFFIFYFPFFILIFSIYYNFLHPDMFWCSYLLICLQWFVDLRFMNHIEFTLISSLLLSRNLIFACLNSSFFWRDLIKISGPNHSYYYTLDLLWKLWFLESKQLITAACEVGMLTQLIINITISSIVTGFKKLFSTNLLARLLSDCSINQSYSKL